MAESTHDDGDINNQSSSEANVNETEQHENGGEPAAKKIKKNNTVNSSSASTKVKKNTPAIKKKAKPTTSNEKTDKPNVEDEEKKTEAKKRKRAAGDGEKKVTSTSEGKKNGSAAATIKKKTTVVAANKDNNNDSDDEDEGGDTKGSANTKDKDPKKEAEKQKRLKWREEVLNGVRTQEIITIDTYKNHTYWVPKTAEIATTVDIWTKMCEKKPKSDKNIYLCTVDPMDIDVSTGPFKLVGCLPIKFLQPQGCIPIHMSEVMNKFKTTKAGYMRGSRSSIELRSNRPAGSMAAEYHGVNNKNDDDAQANNNDGENETSNNKAGGKPNKKTNTSMEWVFIIENQTNHHKFILPMASMAEKINQGLFASIDLAPIFPQGFAWSTDEDCMFIVPKDFVPAAGSTNSIEEKNEGDAAKKQEEPAKVTPAIESFVTENIDEKKDKEKSTITEDLSATTSA